MAYTIATVAEKRQLALGQVRLVVRFTGQGETPADRMFTITEETTLLELRKWAIEQVRQLNNRGTVANTLSLGATIDLTSIP